MTSDDIQQVKLLFDCALLRFGVTADVQTVDAEKGELKVTFALWKRHYVGNFILSDQGLRTAGTVFFWLNAEIHAWQWIAMIQADALDSMLGPTPETPLQPQ